MELDKMPYVFVPTFRLKHGIAYAKNDFTWYAKNDFAMCVLHSDVSGVKSHNFHLDYYF